MSARDRINALLRTHPDGLDDDVIAEKLAANLYRDHPFYEPAEQASMLRTALASVSLDATK